MILEHLDKYAGYTLMKHTYEPTYKYRLQIWFMREGASLPASVTAWGRDPLEALRLCLDKLAELEVS